MIQSVRFENFRCLKDVELSLEPVTVLVGPPASGKTSLLDGFDLLLGCDAADYWRQDGGRPAVVEWRYEQGTSMRVEYPVGTLDSTPMAAHTVQALALDLIALRSESTTGRSPVLNRTGDNLSGVFATLLPGTRQRVVQELCRLVPALGDVALQQTSARTQRLKFRDAWKTDLWFTPDRVADTALLLLAYLVLPYQLPPPDLITLDMPERGLPPPLLGELMTLLRKMSKGEVGGTPIQVVVATASAQVLKHVDAKEIRVLSRSEKEGAVQVSAEPEVVAEWRQRLELA
ncbi:MAG: AAA family ATPase [Hyalangium sp.]|uniref:AAA family ATPase n=1 Tax=Hyalangium sp. TaxID=2028555 RepID=UPI003899B22E